MIEQLAGIPLFRGLNAEQLGRIEKTGEKVSLGAGEYLIREGDDSLDVFIILEGRVEIIKGPQERQVSSLGVGEIVGEIALLERGKRSASVRTLVPTRALALRSQRFIESDDLRDVQSTLMRNITVELCERVRDQNLVTVRTLESQLAESQTRVSSAMFLVNFIMLASVYTLALGALLNVRHLFGGTTPITLGLLFVFVAVLLRFAKKSGHPLSAYGLTWSGARPALVQAAIVSAIGVICVFGVKWLGTELVPSMHGKPLIDVEGALTDYDHTFSWRLWLTYAALYALFCPVQEFIARGCIQGALARFMAGPFAAPTAYQAWTANLIANVAFAAVHSHISLGFAVLTFVPGLVWGWMYQRHPTLVGVSVSHVLIGTTAGFIANVHF